MVALERSSCKIMLFGKLTYVEGYHIMIAIGLINFTTTIKDKWFFFDHFSGNQHKDK